MRQCAEAWAEQEARTAVLTLIGVCRPLHLSASPTSCKPLDPDRLWNAFHNGSAVCRGHVFLVVLHCERISHLNCKSIVATRSRLPFCHCFELEGRTMQRSMDRGFGLWLRRWRCPSARPGCAVGARMLEGIDDRASTTWKSRTSCSSARRCPARRLAAQALHPHPRHNAVFDIPPGEVCLVVSEDYHDTVDSAKFVQWTENQLILAAEVAATRA